MTPLGRLSEIFSGYFRSPQKDAKLIVGSARFRIGGNWPQALTMVWVMRVPLKGSSAMKIVRVISCLFFFGGCASLHSPYDLHDWCMNMGSPRLSSIGPKAQDPVNCDAELDEDLADRTPRFLYAPRDVVMSPVIAARAVWTLLGRTRPPF